jgi:hypothetical protein
METIIVGQARKMKLEREARITAFEAGGFSREDFGALPEAEKWQWVEHLLDRVERLEEVLAMGQV